MFRLNEMKENINRFVLYWITLPRTVLEPFIEPLLQGCSEKVLQNIQNCFIAITVENCLTIFSRNIINHYSAF